MNKLLAIMLGSLLLVGCERADASAWECINRGALGNCNAWRMPVYKGWIVSADHDDHTYAMVFVSDETHQWKVNS